MIPVFDMTDVTFCPNNIRPSLNEYKASRYCNETPIIINIIGPQME